MAKCPWPELIGAHEVPGLDDGDLDVGDFGQCKMCRGRYVVKAVDPYKLAKRKK